MLHWLVGAEHFKIEAVAVEGDDAIELAEFGNERLRIRLKPAPEAVPRVPRDGDGEAEARDARPPSLDLMRKAEGFNVEKDFACRVGEKAGCCRHLILVSGQSNFTFLVAL